MFLPTFSCQVLDGKLLAAVVIVLVLWALQYLIWVRPRDPAVIARRQARLAPVPATAPPPPPPVDAQKDKPEGGQTHA